MKQREKHPGGRPRTVNADIPVNFRFNAETVAALERLAVAWDCSKNEALRRAIIKCAPKE